MKHKVLIVDDEDYIREELVEFLTHQGYDCEEASGVEPALAALHRNSEPAIVVTDIRMPGRDGFDLLNSAKAEVEQDLEFIIMTGHGGIKEVIRGLELGAHDVLQKPIHLKYLLYVVERANGMLYLRRSERLHQESLKAEVETKTAEVRWRLEEIKKGFADALDILAMASDYKDSKTDNHFKSIGAYSRILTSELGWSPERQELIELAAPLRDVGNIGMPGAVLLKPGKLSSDEMVVIKEHPEIGHRILSRSGHLVMQTAANIAWAHHERWDGSGYPRGLKGEEIPVEARIVAFADIYHALRLERPYKPAFDHETALKIMLEGDSRVMPEHFDPDFLKIFRSRSDEFARAFYELAD